MLYTNKYINIKELVKNSNSKLLKRLPGFALNLLARIIMQDEINRILDKYHENTGVDFLPGVLAELNILVDIKGLDNLPDNRKCFFVANHPYGIADGLILTCIVAKRYGTLKAIGNDVFMLIPQLRPLIAAVNVFGSNYRDYLIELDRVYKSDVPITHFPAGLVSRVKNRKIQDFDWHKSFISKAVECERDIVPFCFTGRNSVLFYFVYLLRKYLGIKANLELSLLPYEFFRKKNKSIKVIIGKPISFRKFDKTKTDREWAQWVKSELYSLKNKNAD